MTNAELIKQIQAGSDRAKGLLLEQNRPLIQWAVNRFRGLADPDDLTQDCIVAMLEAAQTHNQERGSFTTWFYFYASKRIMTYNGPLLSIPTEIKYKLHKYRRFLDQYEQQTGSTPDDPTICAALDIPDTELTKIRRADVFICSLQTQTGDNDDLSLQDLIPAPDDPTETAENAAYNENIWAIVDTLPDDQREIIRQKYREGRALKEILQDNPGARTAERKALSTLRNRFSKAEIYAEGMTATGLQAFKRSGFSATERTALKDLGLI